MNVQCVNKRGACKGTHTMSRHAGNILIMTFRDYHFMHISLMRAFQDQGETNRGRTGSKEKIIIIVRRILILS